VLRGRTSVTSEMLLLPILTMAKTELLKITGCENHSRDGDVIFIHGLGGSPRGTWHPKNKEDDDNFWIYWLGAEFPDLGFWSLGYEVEPSAWRGHSMPLAQRAKNILAILENHQLQNRPLIFVTHSMGGLLVKQILKKSCGSMNSSWQSIVDNTKGIVYLSTPHSGSGLANLISNISMLQPSISVNELRSHQPQLIELNEDYQENPKLRSIPSVAYHETKKTKGFLIVDATSANPGIASMGVAIPTDEDHLSICRPASKGDLVYMGVKAFIRKNLVDQISKYNENSIDEKFLVLGNQIGDNAVIYGGLHTTNYLSSRF
jgi:protein SERAC1